MSQNQLVNNNSDDPSYYHNQFKPIDLFVHQHNNQSNGLIYNNKCEYVDNLIKDQLISDNLINNQLISDQFSDQLNKHIDHQFSNEINNQLNQHINAKLLLNDVNDQKSLFINEVLKCTINQSSSEDEMYQDDKCIDARQNNDSALSMCSSDDSVIMITKFEPLAKLMKDEQNQHLFNSLNNNQNYDFTNQDDLNKQLNSTSVTPSSFDQPVLPTASSFSSIEQSNSNFSDKINKLEHYEDDRQDKTLTNEKIDQDDDEWNLDSKRRNSVEDALFPLKEDLADWIIRVFGKFLLLISFNF